MSYRSGFIALIGPPNVGKSTLLNTLLGRKLSIVSPRPQTTRNRILGVKHFQGGQMIFLDTPGILQPRGVLHQTLLKNAWKTLNDVNIILLLVEPFQTEPTLDPELTKRLQKSRAPVFLIINKIDLIVKKDLLPLMEKWSAFFPFQEIIPLSALTGEGVEELTKSLIRVLPEGPPYFPEDLITDLSERFLAAELIREKVFHLTGQEVPYGAAVTIDSFQERADKPLIEIRAVIHTEKESQKAILIGKEGKKLKEIGIQARKDLEILLGAQVYLELWVRVEKNWSRDPRRIKQFGIEDPL